MEFRLRQNNQTVATASGTMSENEIMNYARQYREDGECTVQVKHTLPSGDSWKLHCKLAQFPQPTIKGKPQ